MHIILPPLKIDNDEIYDTDLEMFAGGKGGFFNDVGKGVADLNI